MTLAGITSGIGSPAFDMVEWQKAEEERRKAAPIHISIQEADGGYILNSDRYEPSGFARPQVCTTIADVLKAVEQRLSRE